MEWQKVVIGVVGISCLTVIECIALFVTNDASSLAVVFAVIGSIAGASVGYELGSTKSKSGP